MNISSPRYAKGKNLPMFVDFMPSESDIGHSVMHSFKHILKDIFSDCDVHDYTLTSFFKHLSPYKDYTKDEVASSMDFLVKEITSLEPNIIFTFGNKCFEHLTGKSSKQITRYRDAGLYIDINQKKYKVIPLVSPRVLVYDHKDHSQSIRNSIINNLSSPDSNADYRVLNSLQDIQAYVEYLIEHKPLISWDLETSSLVPYNHDSYILMHVISHEDNQAVCIPVNHIQSVHNNDSHKQIINSYLRKLFTSGIEVINQNIIFDLKWYTWLIGDIDDINVTGDTMIASHFIDNKTIMHSLDLLITDYLNVPSHKNVITDYLKNPHNTIDPRCPDHSKAYAQVPLDILADYALRDADYTRRIWLEQRKIMTDLGILTSYNKIILKAIKFIAVMENDGFQIDLNILRESQEKFSLSIDDLHTEMLENPIVKYAISLYSGKPSLGYHKFMAHLLYNVMGLPKVSQDSDGNEEVINVYNDFFNLESVHPILDGWMKNLGLTPDTIVNLEWFTYCKSYFDNILKYKKDSKLYSTYISKLEKFVNPNTGRIHSNYNLIGTMTGRLSNSDPSLHTFPYQSIVKDPFVSRFENGLIGIYDYSQMELRVAAMYAEDSIMADAFNNDRDIHSEMTCVVFDKTLDEITAEERRIVKTVVFGVIYGKQPQTLGLQLGVSKAVAQSYIDKIFSRAPAIKNYIDRQHQLLNSGSRSVNTILGRRILEFARYQKHAVNNHLQNQYVNHPIQSAASDFTLLAGCNLSEEFRRLKMQSKVVATIHDAVLVDQHPDEHDEVFKIRHRVLVDDVYNSPDINFKVKLKSDCEIGQSWYKLLKGDLKDGVWTINGKPDRVMTIMSSLLINYDLIECVPKDNDLSLVCKRSVNGL